MAHELDSFRLKVNRAHTYMETLQREVDAWRARKPYEVFGEYEPGPTAYYVFRLRFFEPIPLEWGLLVGDFAHNMRSAVDHLAYQLVVAGGGTPNIRTQFPILVLPCAWNGHNGSPRLAGASDRHVGLVEALQPYHRPNSQGFYHPAGAMGDPLAVLAFLNNEDKHRVLHATPVAIHAIGWRVDPVRDIAGVLMNNATLYTGALKDGEELLRVPIVPSGQNPEAKLDRFETLNVTFDQRLDLPEPQGGLVKFRVPLLEEMMGIEAKLWDIFQIFVNEFR